MRSLSEVQLKTISFSDAQPKRRSASETLSHNADFSKQKSTSFPLSLSDAQLQ